MADTKISAMTAATTPLTGAELVPLVQDGVNVKSTIEGINQFNRNTMVGIKTPIANHFSIILRTH